MKNAKAQKEELLVLQSIYDEKCFKFESMNPPCGHVLVDVSFTDPFYIKILNRKGLSASKSNSDHSELDYEEFEINYLPPLNLHFECTDSYPTDSPPVFSLTCCWLSYEQLSKLCRRLYELWNEGNGEVILFQWIQFLKEETLSVLNIDGSLDITQLSMYNLELDIQTSEPPDIQSLYSNGDVSHKSWQTSVQKSQDKCKKNLAKSTHDLKPLISGGSGARDQQTFLDLCDGKILKDFLKDFNESKKTEYFHDSWQLCNICFANKQGSKFVTFKTCQHFYCKDCLKSYFELMIAEGNVHSLKCPHGECSTEADGTLVKQIVGIDVFERYDSLLLSRSLDKMSDLTYCPRKMCQSPVLIDVTEKIGMCPACNFVFCPLCKMAYHGIMYCKMDYSMKKMSFDETTNNKIKEAEYEFNFENELAYKSYFENQSSEKCIRSISKKCPNCSVPIEKTGGCNEMACFVCGIFFCWQCTKQLPHNSSYDCYNPGLECSSLK